jgi:hypothetical protein
VTGTVVSVSSKPLAKIYEEQDPACNGPEAKSKAVSNTNRIEEITSISFYPFVFLQKDIYTSIAGGNATFSRH